MSLEEMEGQQMRRFDVLRIMVVSVQLCSTEEMSCARLLAFPPNPPGREWEEWPLRGHTLGLGIVQGFSRAEGHTRVHLSP